MLTQPGDSESQIRWGFRIALLREPSSAELKSLQELLADTMSGYSQDSAAAMAMATEPLGALPPDMKVEEAAAMTVVSSVILNLDEMLMKR
jgi:hypothetical protein